MPTTGNPCVDRGAAGEQGLSQGRPAVVGERTQQRVGVDKVGGVEAEAGIVGEEVVAQGVEATRGDGDVSALGILEDAIDRVKTIVGPEWESQS